MNLSKVEGFFSADGARVNIVGCGSVGSAIAENLVRCGVNNFMLWDFDYVEPHNLANQFFTEGDIGKLKCEAVKDMILAINPDATVKLKKKGWNNDVMQGYVFLAVDSIEIRRDIVELHMGSPEIKAMFDFRTLLESAQHYAANWSDGKSKEDFLKTMQFSHEEAAEATPVSACGITLGVVTTVRSIVAIGVSNYINFVMGRGLKKLAVFDPFNCEVMAF